MSASQASAASLPAAPRTGARGASRRGTARLVAALWLAASAGGGTSGEEGTGHGVVVAALGPLGAGARAGLQPGDVLLTWRREAAPPANPHPREGAFRSPFDVLDVDLEEAPRGPVTLRLRREGGELSLELPPGGWKLAMHPRLEGPDLEVHQEGQRALEAGDAPGALAAWSRLAARLEDAGKGEESAAMLYRVAEAGLEHQLLDTALEAIAGGVERAETAGHEDWVFHFRLLEAQVHHLRNDLPAAAASAGAAEQIARRRSSPSLAEAVASHRLAEYAWRQGERARSREHLGRTLEIREALAPDSVEVASTLVSVAVTSEDRSDRGPLERAQAIAERLLPDSVLMGRIRYYLAQAYKHEGDLAAAEEAYRGALALHRRLAPGKEDAAWSCYSIANTLWPRGRLLEAEALFREALEIFSREAPGGLGHAAALLALGVVHGERGDHEAALDHYRRSYELHARFAPRSEDLAALHINMGTELHEQGNLEEAERHYLAAQAMRRDLELDDLDSVPLLDRLAVVALERGDRDKAATHAREALEVARRLAPSSLQEADGHRTLGRLAEARGDLAEAMARFREALRITERVAPGSGHEAETLSRLAEVHRRSGEASAALELSRRALSAFESQLTRLGGSQETRSGFSARHGGVYRSYLHLLIDSGRPAEAFHVSERYRARLLLELLAERDLAGKAELPEALDRERRVLHAEYDRQFGLLLQASAEREPEDVSRLQERLEDLRRRRRDLESRVRTAVPRLATLHDPEPLDLEGARRSLDPGTLLLSYVVDPKASYVFAVGPGPEDFRVHRLAASPSELRQAVDRFRTLLGRGPTTLRGGLGHLAGRLSEILLGPVAEPLSRARRVLLLPDGPLHFVPFGALLDPRDEARRRLLVERLPLHFSSSATVFTELKAARSERTALRLAAFGDPRHSLGEGRGSADLRQMARRRLDLSPLPATRSEVEGLRGLFGGSATVWLGAEATETRAKSLDSSVGLVHFACHALVDEDSPFDSALVLSAPGEAGEAGENGLLQVWEVFEQVRLDAELVTLSACETALGKESGGEGILGLTRAFQFAGARTVLASLWRIGDASTAALMNRFYRYLREGSPKDEALRRAQLDLIRGPIEWTEGGKTVRLDASHPFYWAAFQLYGDWR